MRAAFLRVIFWAHRDRVKQKPMRDVVRWQQEGQVQLQTLEVHQRGVRLAVSAVVRDAHAQQ